MKKQQRRNQFTRIALALLLILSMLGNTLILPTVAQETVAPVDDTTSSETPSADEATTDAISTPTLPEPILLTAADIPEFISAAALTERGAVERMRSEETNMSSVIFRNSDGTRTMYMYGLPVKYTSADGTVRDKSTNLVSVSTASVLLSDQPVAQTMAQMSLVQQEALQAELGILDVERAAGTLHMLSTALTARQRSLSDMAYTTLDNDVYALFPTNLAKGMTLVFGEHSVRMTPAGTGMTVTAGGNVTKTTTSSLSDPDVTERLLYPNVFGLGTAVQYTPTLTGVKEEILLSRNVGKNSFAFLLETGGLVLTEQNGQFVLIDPETEQQVGKLGEIIVFDSAGRIVRGNMTAQTILAGQKYGITISVDQEFLASATYPVSIDPTTRINSFNQVDTNLIEDVAVYNHEDAWNYTFEDYHYLGTVPYTSGSTYIGYALYRFPAFYDSSIQFGRESVDLSCLLSFQLHLKSITPNATASTFNLYTAPYQLDWDDNARICSFQASCYCDNSSALCSNVSGVPAQGTFDVDLTEYLEYWINVRDGNITTTSTADFETGVAIGLANSGTLWLEPITDNTYTYATCEYSIVPLDTPVYLFSNYTHTFLGRDTENDLSMMSGLVSDIGNQIAWEFEYVGNDQYEIHPYGISTLYLNGSGNITDNSVSDDEFFQWTISGTNDLTFQNVKFPNRYLGVTTTGSAVVRQDDALKGDRRKWRVVSAEIYDDENATVQAPSSIWLAPGESIDVYGILNCMNLFYAQREYFSVDSSNQTVVSVENEMITAGTANETATVSITHMPTGVSATITVNVTSLANGEYYFRNGSSFKFMSCLNIANLSLETYSDSNQLKWIITRQQGEFYTIKSKQTGAYLSYSGLSACMSSSNATLWTIRRTANGMLLVELASLPTWALTETASSNLRFALYIDDDYDDADNDGDNDAYNDEWIITPHRYASIVHHYYDNGQVSKYGEDAVDTIYDTQMSANQYFADIFDMEIILAGVDYYESCPDLCEYITSHESPICGDTDEDGDIDASDNPDPDHIRVTYHTFSGEIDCYCNDSETYIDTFRYTGDSMTTHILWSGYKSRYIESDGKATYNRSFASPPDGFILMSRADGDVVTLVHELAHLFAADDHYCETLGTGCRSEGRCDNDDHTDLEDQRPGWCIMDRTTNEDPPQAEWSDISIRGIDNIFCSHCKAEILAHLQDHH